MDALATPSFAAVIAAVAVFACVDAGTSRLIRDAGVRSGAIASIVGAGMALACIPFCLGSVPLSVLFLCAVLVSLAAYLLSGGASQRNILVANAGTLCFVLACGLVFYSEMLVSSWSQGISAAEGRLGPGAARNISLAISLLLACVFMTALGRLMQRLPASSPKVDATLKPLSLFVVFSLANELLDALPLSQVHWFELMPYLQLGGTVLLTVSCAVFSLGTSQLGVEALRDSEDMELERKRREQDTQMRLYRLQAETDPLTQVLTRRKGQALLDRLQCEQRPYALAFVDANGLKRFNDEHGHAAGDRYLVAFSKALSLAAEPAKTVRWGGDEFVVIAEGESEQALFARLGTVEASVDVRGGVVPIRFSYGVASSFDGETPADVLRVADERMYAGKQAIYSTRPERDSQIPAHAQGAGSL